MANDRLLHIYLNDHLAGQAAAMALAERCLSPNRGTPLGEYLVGFIQELKQDRAELEGVMRRVGARQSQLKQTAARALERVGRLKLNGQILSYSDLSRLEELEALCLGVEGKMALWQVLDRLRSADPRLSSTPVEELLERATRQRATLEEHRQAAAAVAFEA